PRERGGDATVVASLGPAPDPPQHKRGGGGWKFGSSIKSLDRRERRPRERARRSFRANTGNRESVAGSDRSDEAVRADPDHSQPDQVRSQLRQRAQLSHFRS